MKTILANGALALSVLLLCQCGPAEPQSVDGGPAAGVAEDAGAESTTVEVATEGQTLVEALVARFEEDEPVRYAPSQLVDKILPDLEAAGIKTRALNDYNNDQYFCNQLLSNLRNEGSLWLIMDRDDQATIDTLTKFFISQHRCDYNETFDAEALILVHVHNELAPDAAPVARLSFEPATSPGWMITDIDFSPDGKLLFYTTLNARLKWVSLDDPKQKGTSLEMPLLRNGDDNGVYIGGESGMIGLAVSPTFATDRKVYTHYNFKYEDESRFAIVSEWTLERSGEMLATDERILLKLTQTHDTHNGGALEFGPDGCLYISIGDGEQGKWTIGRSPAAGMRGKILRIDLASKDEGKEYHVPADNPFVGHGEIPPETWAWGFRNPWRMTFTADGRMIVGEIGEDRNEEITFVERGRHHGWPYIEGTFERNEWALGDEIEPVDPLVAYGRDKGMSVIGGHVYDGDEIGWLKGKYLFADYMSGRIWAIDVPEPGADLPLGPADILELGRWPVQFTSFGKHPSGELYVAQSGRVFRVKEGDPDSAEVESSPALMFSDSQAMGTFGNELSVHRREVSDAEVELGRKLFVDMRLSRDGATSCASCHDPDNHGIDGLAVARGGRRNTPSVFNAHRAFAQFWDYRAETVEDVLLAHGLMSRDEIVSALVTARELKPAFEQAYPGEGLTPETAGRAIGAFLRKLETPSRWERFLDGDADALTAPEKQGLSLFVSTGCATCHQFRTLGGNMSQKLGLIEEVGGDDKGKSEIDPQIPAYYFKVPGLINVGNTAPYYHDGSIPTLEGAVDHMARVQLGRKLDAAAVKSIATFLRSMDGEKPKALTRD